MYLKYTNCAMFKAPSGLFKTILYELHVQIKIDVWRSQFDIF